jgi:hypothetical protein
MAEKTHLPGVSDKEQRAARQVCGHGGHVTEGASDETKSRYAFVYGDFRRVHRTGLIACNYRAAEWRHKDIELAAHRLLQRLDRAGA